MPRDAVTTVEGCGADYSIPLATDAKSLKALKQSNLELPRKLRLRPKLRPELEHDECKYA